MFGIGLGGRDEHVPGQKDEAQHVGKEQGEGKLGADLLVTGGSSTFRSYGRIHDWYICLRHIQNVATDRIELSSHVALEFGCSAKVSSLLEWLVRCLILFTALPCFHGFTSVTVQTC